MGDGDHSSKPYGRICFIGYTDQSKPSAGKLLLDAANMNKIDLEA
jgi:hypothetical protein